MPQLIIRLMIYDSQLFKQDYKDVKYLYNNNLQIISLIILDFPIFSILLNNICLYMLREK